MPDLRKAVKWNTPFYGLAGRGWFLGFHCLTGYVKVAFMPGAALDPPPPVASKQKDVRYLHIREHEPLDKDSPVNGTSSTVFRPMSDS